MSLHKFSYRALAFSVFSFAFVPLSWGASAKLTPQEIDFFETKIHPIFAENCFKCHSQTSEKIKGGLLLDSHEAVLKGGNTGPVIVPGNPDKSLLIQAVRYKDKDLQMPPNDRKLSDEQIADLEKWVKIGAPDPRVGGAGDQHNYAVDFAKAKKHWAFQPVVNPLRRADIPVDIPVRSNDRSSNAPGARAVPGSQRPRMPEDDQMYSRVRAPAGTLRAGDGSRSGSGGAKMRV